MGKHPHHVKVSPRGQTESESERGTDIQREGWTDIHTDRQTYREREREREGDRLKRERQRQRDRETEGERQRDGIALIWTMNLI